MSYKIAYSEASEQDLVNIFGYISMNAIAGLEELPLRHKLYQNEPFHSRGLRVLPVDNYLVLYTVIEKAKTVAIIRIMYGGRNIDLQL